MIEFYKFVFQFSREGTHKTIGILPLHLLLPISLLKLNYILYSYIHIHVLVYSNREGPDNKPLTYRIQ